MPMQDLTVLRYKQSLLGISQALPKLVSRTSILGAELLLNTEQAIQ